jgi:hypothetical protein
MPELRYLDLQFLVEKGDHEACFLFTERLCRMLELPTSLESLTLRALCLEEDTRTSAAHQSQELEEPEA